MFRATVFATLGIAVVVLPSGCATGPAALERAERDRLERSRPVPMRAGTASPLPGADAPLAEQVRYALLHHPAVFGAYSEWRAAVASIAPAGALPDPQLTFEADVARTVMALMPGLMFDLMSPGKRVAMAREMAASSEVAHREYLASAVRVAGAVREAWVELAYVDEAVRLREHSLGLLEQSSELASAAYSTGAGMATFEGQIRFANETARIRAELEALSERRRAAQVGFKAALGLRREDPDPAWPRPTLTPSAVPPEEELWQRVLGANPELAKMRAMVDMAVAGEEVARQRRWPDFAAGLMADVKPAPWMWRPTATMTLPLWRKKITGQIEAARARRDAAAARVDAELLDMAAELARMLYMVRESDRMIAFIDRTALPNLERTIATASAAFEAGMGSPAMIPDAQLMAYGMRGERLAALRVRALAVTGRFTMPAAVAAGPASPGLAATRPNHP